MINLLSTFLLLAIIPFTHSLYHLPLQRNPLPVTRLFSLHHRPWAVGVPIQPTLNLPLKLLNNSKALPEQPVYGSIIPLGEYYLTLKFGDQPINVQIDTGSSTIAVPLSECLNCRRNDHRLDLKKATGTAGFIACDSPACRPNTCHAISSCTTCSKKTRACCSLVAPSACGFFLQYADMSGASGALVQADVTIAGMTVPLAFGAILRETDDFESTSVDGILGMAYKSLACNPTCVVPLFDTLVQSGKVKNDIFSLCTAPNGGTLTLGGSDSKYYKGELQYVPMNHKGTPHFYDVALKGVLVGDRKVKIPHFSDAIVDSGTTVLVITPRAYAALRAHFQEYYCDVPGLCVSKGSRRFDESAYVVKTHPPHHTAETPQLDSVERATEQTWFSPGYCARLTKQHISLLPNIRIRLDDDIELVLEPEVYMLEYQTSSKLGWERITYRCLGISYLEGMELMSNNVILGNTVLQKYFVEYDRDSNRIGFAIAQNCYDPSTRMLEENAFVGDQGGLIPPWIMRVLTIASLCAWFVVILICARDARKRQGYARILDSAASSS